MLLGITVVAYEVLIAIGLIFVAGIVYAAIDHIWNRKKKK